MKAIITLLILFATIFSSCSTSRLIRYSFESKNVIDSITQVLKKYEKIHQESYEKVKWIALLRETGEGFDLIINEKFGTNKSPINVLSKKSNRFLLIGSLKIPILFESDLMISSEMREANIGHVNWGGYYFKIVQKNYSYIVAETGLLF